MLGCRSGSEDTAEGPQPVGVGWLALVGAGAGPLAGRGRAPRSWGEPTGSKGGKWEQRREPPASFGVKG